MNGQEHHWEKSDKESFLHSSFGIGTPRNEIHSNQSFQRPPAWILPPVWTEQDESSSRTTGRSSSCAAWLIADNFSALVQLTSSPRSRIYLSPGIFSRAAINVRSWKDRSDCTTLWENSSTSSSKARLSHPWQSLLLFFRPPTLGDGFFMSVSSRALFEEEEYEPPARVLLLTKGFPLGGSWGFPILHIFPQTFIDKPSFVGREKERKGYL